MKHETLYVLAHAAGQAAAEQCHPTPMVVFEPGDPFGPDEGDITRPSGRIYAPVMDGVCGFAWVVVQPGTCSFARWLVKQGHAKKHYYGGVSVWVSGYNQSMERKEAYAHAFAKALSINGIKAYAQSRMD